MSSSELCTEALCPARASAEQVREAGDRGAEVRLRAASKGSFSDRPSRPRTSDHIGLSMTWKPVAKMSVSSSWWVPSPIDDAVRDDLGDRGRDDLALRAVIAGYHAFEPRMRLQPMR